MTALQDKDLAAVLAAARDCTLCADKLPHPPRPVVRALPSARLMIIGQAPGRRVHESGIPWNDPSGDRLRDWLAVDRDQFYDEERIAIVPMGFCFPGTDPRGADFPPQPICAPTWHDRIRRNLPDIQLTLLVGGYAQKRYLGKAAHKTLTQTVAHWREYGPDYLPLPHPSWRNTAWIKKNPWFEKELLPSLRDRTAPFFA
ncbi:MAG: uracil-DNA glycosylase family protein [Pseudomonadota bacterium]